MSRYIDADLEIQKIEETQAGISDKASVGYFALDQFKHMLEIAPTAERQAETLVERILGGKGYVLPSEEKK